MGTAIVVLAGLLLLLITVGCKDLLYPWGKDNGDTTGPTVKGFYPIPMNHTIRFFRKSYQNLSICSRGEIGFVPVKNTERRWQPPFCGCGSVFIAPFSIDQNLGNYAEYGSPYNYLIEFMNYYNYDGTQRSEHLWYRTTSNKKLLCRAEADVRSNFCGCHKNFRPKELFIATWTDVHDIDLCDNWDEAMCTCVMNQPFAYRTYTGYSDGAELYCDCIVNHADNLKSCFCDAFLQRSYSGQYNDLLNISFCECLWYNDADYCECELNGNCQDTKRSVAKREIKEVNTYQVVLITNGRQTYAMFNYKSIKWVYINTKDYASGTLENREPMRKYAFVGFWNNDKCYSHPYARTDDMYKLANESNVGEPGRWMYKISGQKILTPDDCEIN